MKIRGINEPSADPVRPMRREVLRYCVGATVMISIPGASFAGVQPRNVVVETAHGKLRGLAENGVAVFKGVPYGQSTAGNNRFLPPQPLTPWAGIRDATRLGHPCLQTNPDFPVWLDPMPGSEDCLALNVWSPASAHPTSKLPVMVWLHGGGYTFGSAGAPLYDCGNLARSGNIVAVGINHRLQAFGYSDVSAHGGPRFAASGNAGQLDILAALEWVRTNIEEFGGDPNNVTLFGQSGGGAKISTLMGMPASDGLFHRAIVQSGSVFRYRSKEEAEATSNRMFSILGIQRNDMAALQAVPADALVRCGVQIMGEAAGIGDPSLKYAPVIDGEDFPKEIWRANAPERTRRMPLLLGSTRDETIIYMSDEARKAIADDDALARAVVDGTPAYAPNKEHVAELIPFYRRAMPESTNFEVALQMSTDLSYWKGAVHQAELQSSAGAPVFMYRCDWRTPCFGAQWAPHALEIPFVMGHEHYGSAWDGKDTDQARAEADPGGARFKLGNRMLAAWVSFARHGNPSLPDLAWPAYTQKSRSTMIFDRESKVHDNPRSEIRTLLRSV